MVKLEVEMDDKEVCFIARDTLTKGLGYGGKLREMIVKMVEQKAKAFFESIDYTTIIQTAAEKMLDAIVKDVVGAELRKRCKVEAKKLDAEGTLFDRLPKDKP